MPAFFLQVQVCETPLSPPGFAPSQEILGQTVDAKDKRPPQVKEGKGG
jgi:hypothetical protein